MDMSVKLNTSYAVVPPVPLVADNTATAPPVVPAVASSATADTATGKDSDAKDKAEALKAAVKDIEKYVQSVRRNLEFSIDEASGKVVVKVIASETGEVVRQLPSAEALKIADSLHNAHSLLFNAKV